MDEFKINKQLMHDCYKLGALGSSHILLMNNSLLPWLVIVPEVQATEFFDIEDAQQQIILQQINQLSRFISKEFKTDKLNIASPGNIVKQMHIQGTSIN
jgi:diadenosine tetraphosphate (Ap4A) HIT family hydrolase